MNECPSRTNGTIEHFKTARWCDLKRRCVNTPGKSKVPHYLIKRIECRITKEEFYRWCEKQKEHILNLFKVGEKPTIDRINPDGHYELSNMRIISLTENIRANRKHKNHFLRSTLKQEKQKDSKVFGIENLLLQVLIPLLVKK